MKLKLRYSVLATEIHPQEEQDAWREGYFLERRDSWGYAAPGLPGVLGQVTVLLSSLDSLVIKRELFIGVSSEVDPGPIMQDIDVLRMGR